MLGVAFEFENYPSTDTKINATNLNNMQKLLIDLIYPVGIYIEISDSNFDPNNAWGGNWVLENDGTVLVSKSSSSSSKFNDDIGKIIGEENHILTIDETPEHYHELGYDVGMLLAAGNQRGNAGTGNTYGQGWITKSAGGNQPHNNVQPSKIVNRWHRTA